MVRLVDVIARRDDGAWAAWSPQAPGLAIVQPTPRDLVDQLPMILRGYFADGDPLEVRIHVEHELQGASGVVIRVAQDERRWDRQHIADRIAGAFGVPGQAERMRSDSPFNQLGEVIFACALADDTVDWIARQVGDDGDAINIVYLVGDNMLNVFPVIGARADEGGGFEPTATIAELASMPIPGHDPDAPAASSTHGPSREAVGPHVGPPRTLMKI